MRKTVGAGAALHAAVKNGHITIDDADAPHFFCHCLGLNFHLLVTDPTDGDGPGGAEALLQLVGETSDCVD